MCKLLWTLASFLRGYPAALSHDPGFQASRLHKTFANCSFETKRRQEKEKTRKRKEKEKKDRDLEPIFISQRVYFF